MSIWGFILRCSDVIKRGEMLTSVHATALRDGDDRYVVCDVAAERVDTTKSPMMAASAWHQINMRAIQSENRASR